MDNADLDRIAGRKWAEEVLADLPSQSEDFRTGFRRRMLAEYRVEEIDHGAMSDGESRDFGRRVLNFGVHRDKCYDETPLDYLEWLATEGVHLARYVKSRRVKAEQDQE